MVTLCVLACCVVLSYRENIASNEVKQAKFFLQKIFFMNRNTAQLSLYAGIPNPISFNI